jgi:hypothetical protein
MLAILWHTAAAVGVSGILCVGGKRFCYSECGEPPTGGPPVEEGLISYNQMRMISPSLERITTTAIDRLWVTVPPLSEAEFHR